MSSSGPLPPDEGLARSERQLGIGRTRERSPQVLQTGAAGGAGGWVSVGRVGRPHGLAGAFVVEQASEDPARFAAGTVVHVAGEPAKVVESKRSGGRLVVRLDRPVPRGSALEVARSSLPVPEPDSYYVADLVGLAVEEEGGRALGAVVQVDPGPANDVLELDSGVRLPLIEDCVLEVDLEGGRIVVAMGFADPQGIARDADPEDGAAPPRRPSQPGRAETTPDPGDDRPG